MYPNMNDQSFDSTLTSNKEAIYYQGATGGGPGDAGNRGGVAPVGGITNMSMNSPYGSSGAAGDNRSVTAEAQMPAANQKIDSEQMPRPLKMLNAMSVRS